MLHRGWQFIDLGVGLGLAGWGLECLNDTMAMKDWAKRYPPGPLWAARHFCDFSDSCRAHDSAIVIINHVDRIPKLCAEETIRQSIPSKK